MAGVQSLCLTNFVVATCNDEAFKWYLLRLKTEDKIDSVLVNAYTIAIATWQRVESGCSAV